MNVTKKSKIGLTVEKSVKRYRESPGDFTLAANAAAYYAKKYNKTMVIVPGNSYGKKVYHIANESDDLAKFLGFTTLTLGAIAEVDGNIYYAELS